MTRDTGMPAVLPNPTSASASHHRPPAASSRKRGIRKGWHHHFLHFPTTYPALSNMNQFFEIAKQYKEMILLIASLIAGIFFVRDYFATKQEVEVLKCQAENGIALVESRINVELTTKKIISLQKEIEDQKERARNRTGQATSDSPSLSLEINRLKDELGNEYETQRRAADNLKPGACERAVKK